MFRKMLLLYQQRFVVMRLEAVTILSSLLLASCAVSPQKICAPHAPDTWQYLGQDKSLATLFEPILPHAPYTTNEGKIVRSVQHVWFRGGDYLLLACTLAHRARNDCSVRTTEFQLIGNAWVTRSEDTVVCNVLTYLFRRETNRWSTRVRRDETQSGF